MTNIPNNPDDKARLFLSYREKGLGYNAIAEICGATSGDAVRNVIRRYNERTHGTYSSSSLLDRDTPIIVPEPKEYITDGEKILDESPEAIEIWFVDIERFPRIEYSWAAKKYSKFTPEYLLVEEGRMISFAAKKLGGPTIFSSEYHHGRNQMLDTLWYTLDRADVVVGWNSRRFDIPHIDGELRTAGYKVYKPFKQIDLFQQIRSRFNYQYNTMASVAKQWKLDDQKMENEGFELWKRCMSDDPEAWETMKLYNMQDVRTTEKAYLSNLSWMSGTIPNLGLFLGDVEDSLCPACGSSEVTRDGTAVTGVSMYEAYRCDSCGFRSRSNVRVNSVKLRPVTR